MRPIIFAVALAFVGATALSGAMAQSVPPSTTAQSTKAPAAATPKAGPGEKVCRHKFPSGEARAWVCKKEEPCCAWDEIKYVKCGSTVFKCL